MPGNPAKSRHSVLIVEDEVIVAADIDERLQRMGYDTLGPAASAEEALELARRYRPALALTDIRLQGPLDGIALAETMRTELGLPVVFLTAHADQTTLDRAQITEPFGYLLKPFDDRLLEITLGMAIFRHSAERERARLSKALAQARSDIQVLTGLLSTCSYCHKIEDSGGDWIPIETYITRRSNATFSHTYCPTCLRREFPDIAEKVLKNVESKARR